MLTDQQIKNRKKGIGGSDAAAICGVSKYKSSLQVYNDKVGDSSFNNDGNINTEIGHALEGFVADKYSQEMGVDLVESEQTHLHKDHPFLIAHIDRGIKGKRAALEVKTTNDLLYKEYWGEEGSDSIPMDYLMQCAHYSNVLNLDYIDIRVLVIGGWKKEIKSFRYNKNQKLEDSITKKECIFWNENVLKNISPPASYLEEIKEMYKSVDSSKSVSINNDILNALKKQRKLKALIKQAEQELKGEQKIIFGAMQDSESIVDIDGSKLFTWKSQSRAGFDKETLQKENSELYERYVTQTSFRVGRETKNLKLLLEDN
ncbi:MAG: YqaJ viral recombinase family protein [Bacteroidetes bacterium]|nr:YqaJ viral recombinase family protein [Bacteroidota bacterium]